MEKNDKLPLAEESDFHYLLTILPPLYDVPEFAWLPELFSVIGYEKLVKLCGYAGGEQIKLPTIETLSNSIEALQLFYDVYLVKKKEVSDIPNNLMNMVQKIRMIFNAQNRQKFG
jgi:hypothetical protein